MPSLNEAVAIILENVRTMGIEEKPLLESVGQVLAEDVFSGFDLPQTDTSGPDGYAVQAADLKDASREKPVTLRITETVRAGHMPKNAVKAGTAMRIMTGAVLPAGADAVVRFEDTDEPADKNGPNKNNPSEVQIYLAVLPGANVNKAGHNFAKGALVLAKGKTIGAAQVSVLSLIGRSKVKVFRRPVIAVLSTGDELITSGEALVPGKSYDCNGPAIATLVRHYGGVPRMLGIALDDEESVLSRMKTGLDADAVLVSGGVSKGDYDLVRLAVAKLGEVKFVRVRTVPGASVSFGSLKPASGKGHEVPVFALAGPPHGCLINFETLVRPALLKMLGFTAVEHPFVEAPAPEAFPEKKMIFVKWTSLEKTGEGYRVKMKDVRMAEANAMTLLPEGKVLQAGENIRVWPLDWRPDDRV